MASKNKTWAAIRYSSEHILDYIELQDDHAIMEVTIPPEWMNRTIGEINIRKKYACFKRY